MNHRMLYVMGAALILALAVGWGAVRLDSGTESYPDPVPLRISGLLGDPAQPDAAVSISTEMSPGASYLPASTVLRLPDGRLYYLPPGKREPVAARTGDPGVERSLVSSRVWLEEGDVPGRSITERRMAERALLDLRLLTRTNGATVAAPNPHWNYVWPRDASWVSAAFAATGHNLESFEILHFLSEAQKDDGTWEARYRADDGAPVLDGRTPQLDAVGWYPWAVWLWYVSAPQNKRTDEKMQTLWPSVQAAADAAADSLGTNGLPPGGPDYWEIPTWRTNLGTAAPLRTGLRSASDLARGLGREDDARRYGEAAARLDAAIEREFAANGYPRTTKAGSGADAAVTFLAPPFAPPDPSVSAAVEESARRLTTSNGGILPGERWRQDPEVAWTPETAFFALSAASGGDTRSADHYLSWLAKHRTSLGSFPEKVDREGEPQAAAPLGWTSAAVLLALAAREANAPATEKQRRLVMAGNGRSVYPVRVAYGSLPVPPVPVASGGGEPTLPPLAPLAGALLAAGFLVGVRRFR